MHIELPSFKLLMLAPFSPTLETNNPPRIKAEPSSIDQALAEINPSLDISLDRNHFPAASINISISRMADFRPKNISRTPEFKNIISQMAEDVPAPKPTTPTPKSSAVLDDILSMINSGQTEQSTATPGQHERPKANCCRQSSLIRFSEKWRPHGAVWNCCPGRFLPAAKSVLNSCSSPFLKTT